MAEVIFLPWLGLRRETTVAGVTLVSWEEFQQAARLGGAERSWLSLYFSRYRRRDGETPVETVTIVQPRDANEEGVAGAYRTVRATGGHSTAAPRPWARPRGIEPLGDGVSLDFLTCQLR